MFRRSVKVIKKKKKYVVLRFQIKTLTKKKSIRIRKNILLNGFKLYG